MTNTYEIKDISGGELSQEMVATMKFATNKGEIALKMNRDVLSRSLVLAVRLQRIPYPAAGATLDLRAFPVAWWQVGRTPDYKDVVMGFEIEGDGHLAFSMDRAKAQRLHEMLGDTLAKMPV